MARRLKKFRGDTSTSPEVIDSNTMTFTFSRLKLFAGTTAPLGYALASLGQSVAHVKI